MHIQFVSVWQGFRRCLVMARKWFKGILALSVIPALFTVGGVLLQQHLDHSFQTTTQQRTRLEKRIDTENQLLADFVSNSSELLALRAEVLLSHANASVRSHIAIACEHRHAKGKSVKASAETFESMACRDEDWNSDTRKQIDVTQGLFEKATEKNAKLQSAAAEIDVLFGAGVGPKLAAFVQLTNTHPLLNSPTLEAFERDFSVEQFATAPVTQKIVDDLIKKVQADIGQDPLKPLTQAVIAQMAQHLHHELSSLPELSPIRHDETGRQSPVISKQNHIDRK